MISIQSHNQVLYHLTQLLSACTPKTPNYTRLKKRQITTKKNCQILCQESFNETVKNLSELSWPNLTTNELCILEQKLTKRNIRSIVNKLNILDKNLNRLTYDDNNWRVSYVSKSNFFENQRAFSCSPYSSSSSMYTILNTSNNDIMYSSTRPGRLIAPISSSDISMRAFKTNRNVKAENERNPPLSGRFKSWLGLSKFSEEKPKILLDRMDVGSLKNLFNDTELSETDKQRVKVAFAEGYIAGHDRKTSRVYKWFRSLIQLALTLGTISVIIIILANLNGGMFRIPLANHSAIDPEDIHVTFDDVKGVDEAKQELKDVVEFLKNPDKFCALGGKLPKGVLLVGPPGTGKTLLARAVAGEARVPFFHAAGPEFDEVLVGQGARRVRDLFKAAKERAPCVVFIDEIDSVGSKRTTSLIHPYANQTVNQLLSEMDGFHSNEGVIVLGATNRRDDLDQALRRPGRFDVEVFVHKPDLKGRKEILQLYLSKILAKNLDIESLARKTAGFTGADIEAMVNQAALRAAINGAEYVNMECLDAAREKIIMGPELRGRIPDSEENRITAYHEAGHALVTYFSKETSMHLSKVTIIPRAGSFGHTTYLPKKDHHHQTKAQLLALLDSLLGGRAAEEIIFGPDKVTVGAANDFQKATEIAEAMVKTYGMSEKVGFRSDTRSSREESLQYSPSTTELIDAEIKRLLQEAFERAKTILKTHSKEHKLLAEALLKYETLDVDEVKTILSDKKVESISDKRSPIIDIPTNVM
ncbi:ATP-dependent zinc metalloprotease YME1L isoform X2 [Chelonus insularis]|uniref:ATP-dependent zinc metalloprotease YME1L isoform X2 n=1 Tax=Chelonus insularis TaxID=460826 RepID=UPI00158F427F|nr:ATP-dependent zinc metalloprotease YME1L isoform X2 [Chelonus insularis]